MSENVGVDLLSAFRSVDAAGYQPAGVTIAGVRLSFNVDPVAAAPSEPSASRSMYLGLLCASRDSIVAPDHDPETELNMDWMWWERIFVPSGVSKLSDQGIETVTRQIKSRRRCEEVGDSLCMFLNVTTNLGNTQFSYASSVLLLMP